MKLVLGATLGKALSGLREKGIGLSYAIVAAMEDVERIVFVDDFAYWGTQRRHSFPGDFGARQSEGGRRFLSTWR